MNIVKKTLKSCFLLCLFRQLLLYTHTCPVTEFAVASHLNTANSCCHHVFLRHFRFQKCLPVYSNLFLPVIHPIFFIFPTLPLSHAPHTASGSPQPLPVPGCGIPPDIRRVPGGSSRNLPLHLPYLDLHGRLQPP